VRGGKTHCNWGMDGTRESGWPCTSGWLRPKYSGPAMAVLGGGGRFSPALRRASISELMRFSTCNGTNLSGQTHDPS